MKYTLYSSPGCVQSVQGGTALGALYETLHLFTLWQSCLSFFFLFYTLIYAHSSETTWTIGQLDKRGDKTTIHRQLAYCFICMSCHRQLSWLNQKTKPLLHAANKNYFSATKIKLLEQLETITLDQEHMEVSRTFRTHCYWFSFAFAICTLNHHVLQYTVARHNKNILASFVASLSL